MNQFKGITNHRYICKFPAWKTPKPPLWHFCNNQRTEKSWLRANFCSGWNFSPRGGGNLFCCNNMANSARLARIWAQIFQWLPFCFAENTFFARTHAMKLTRQPGLNLNAITGMRFFNLSARPKNFFVLLQMPFKKICSGSRTEISAWLTGLKFMLLPGVWCKKLRPSHFSTRRSLGFATLIERLQLGHATFQELIFSFWYHINKQFNQIEFEVTAEIKTI